MKDAVGLHYSQTYCIYSSKIPESETSFLINSIAHFVFIKFEFNNSNAQEMGKLTMRTGIIIVFIKLNFPRNFTEATKLSLAEIR